MNWFASRTVDSITASLADMVEQLKSHALAKSQEAAKHTEESDRIRALADDAHREAVKATETAYKIGALIS